MLINGIGISGYRSFGKSLQFIGPFDKLNVFVGQNNVGKSNILTFLASQYSSFILALKQNRGFDMGSLDKHLPNERTLPRFALPIDFNAKPLQPLLSRIDPSIIAAVKKTIHSAHTFVAETPMEWVVLIQSEGNQFLLDPTFVQTIGENIPPDNHHYWRSIWSALHSNSNSGGLIQTWIPQTLTTVFQSTLSVPVIRSIPAIRQVGPQGSASKDNYSGLGLIEDLASLQNPKHTEWNLKIQFEEINLFLQTVLANNTAQIHIPQDKDSILVEMDNKVLPLTSLGTGIEEVIIIAAAATVSKNTVLCIEEPELHLHPLLQKKLMQYLSEKTSNQYFITTHSADILNTELANVFHVQQKDGSTIVDSVPSATDRVLLLQT